MQRANGKYKDHLVGQLTNRVLKPSGLILVFFSLDNFFTASRREKTDQIVGIGCEWILIVWLSSSKKLIFKFESISRSVCSVVAVFGFYQMIRGAGGRRHGGIYLQNALSVPKKTKFLCSLLSSSLIFLQGQDSWSHILCDVWGKNVKDSMKV